MSGSAFAFEIDDRQYLATARHVVEGIAGGDHVAFMIDNKWEPALTTGVWHCPDPSIDVSVLSIGDPILPVYPTDLSLDGIAWGQQVYFLGYPFGMTGGAIMHDGRPLPFIKHGIMSASEGTPISVLYIDGANNQGFSGGPLAFWHLGRFRIAGVVSGWRSSLVKIEVRDLLDSQFRESDALRVAIDTGIITAYSIRYAVDGARLLRTGAHLPTSSRA